MRRRADRPASAESGFNLIELVITVAVIGLIAAWGYPALLKTMNRMRLMSIARETSIFMQKARMEAVKRDLNTEVLYLKAADCSLGLPCLIAFTDVDGDGLFIDGIDDLIAGPHPLPKGIELRAPTEVREGAGAIDLWDVGGGANDGPIFNTDGSAEAGGAFRFADANDHFIEVRIEFLGTAKPTIRKWFGGGDPDTNWYENGELGKHWTW